MKKIVVAPDSFKGTLSSQQVCREIARAAGKVFPGCQVIAVPVADGGEGSVEAFLSAVGGERRELEVQGPFGERVPRLLRPAGRGPHRGDRDGGLRRPAPGPGPSGPGPGQHLRGGPAAGPRGGTGL